MSSAPRYSAYFDFYFNVVQAGAGPQQMFNTVIGSVHNYNMIMPQLEDANATASRSLRRLALDLRLVSSSLRSIVREYNMQNTALGFVIGQVGVFVSVLTLAISASNAWKAIMDALNITTVTFTAVVTGAMKATWAFLLPLLPAIAVIGSVALALWSLNFAFEEYSGIHAYRKEIKQLEEELEILERQMRNVQVAQAALNVSSAAVAAETAMVTSQFKQGIITEEEYERRMAVLDAMTADIAASTSEWGVAQAFINSETTKGKDAQEDYKDSITNTKESWLEIVQEWLKGIPNPMMGRGGVWKDLGQSILTSLAMYLPGAQQGGTIARTGPIFAHAGESIIPRGEMMGGMSLTISLAGAQIYGREGLEEALQAGGEKVMRQLEYMRRPRVRW